MNILQMRAENNSKDAFVLSALEEALEAGRLALENLTDSLPAPSLEAKQPVNINQLLREALAISTEQLLAQGVTVEWQPSMHLPSVIGRGRRLRSMFKQVIENAIDAMSQRSVKKRELSVATRAEKDIVICEISDTGPGIPAELLVKVFQPFFSTKTSGHGCRGMGLPMVQEIASDHSGTVYIDPDYHQGCRVVIHIPVSSAG